MTKILHDLPKKLAVRAVQEATGAEPLRRIKKFQPPKVARTKQLKKQTESAKHGSQMLSGLRKDASDGV